MASTAFAEDSTDCRRTSHPALFAAALLTFLLGCGEQEEVRHYRVPKPELVYSQNHVESKPAARRPADGSTEPMDRLFGAIIPRGARTWYFKMTGPKNLVAQQGPAFSQLIKSLQFDAPEASPTWTLPASWKEEVGTGQRLATLSVEVEGQKLEVSVIQLPTSPSDTSTLDNVNRWRRQMSLAPFDQEQLESKTSTVAVSDGTAVLVQLLGNYVSTGRPNSMPRDGANNGQ